MKIYFYATLTAFGLSFVFCLLLIPLLRKVKAGQNILSYVKEHEKKKGTPTMGGLAFILASVIAVFCFLPTATRPVLVAIAITLSYMLVGLFDDFLKCKHKENLGLRAYQKFGFQTVIAVLAGIFCYRYGITKLQIPFVGGVWEIGWLIIPIVVFVFLATVNAVNLTDGLDGLATGSCIPFLFSMGIIITIQQSESVHFALQSFSIVGALIGYLIFNTPPASVFMGDTGSLALGGAISCIAIFSGNTLYIPIIGLPFVLSAVSVVLQVIYFKLTKGKRIFLMSPIHHHFQKKGYSESKISYAYFVVGAVIGATCIVTLL